MKIKKVELIKTAYEPMDYPEPKEGEIAFAGRSNVGKSSLLNKILKIKIAKVSSTPGKTRSINFYLVNKKYYFVDLPGYGYSKVSKKEKMRWKKLMEDYFENRYSLQMVYLLIDHRHGLLNNDRIMIEYLKSLSIPFTVVLTKTDKLSKNERAKRLKEIKDDLYKNYGEYLIIQTSSKTGEGINILLNEISLILGVRE